MCARLAPRATLNDRTRRRISKRKPGRTLDGRWGLPLPDRTLDKTRNPLAADERNFPRSSLFASGKGEKKEKEDRAGGKIMTMQERY